MPPVKKPRLLPLAAALAACFALASAPTFADDRVFDVVAPFEIGGLDPAISGFVFQRMQITETLFETDANGQPLPALAERWVVSDDGKQWALTLRQDVMFHDGSPLNAEAAAHSLNMALKRPGLLRNAKVQAITAKGNEVIVTLSEPFKPLPALLAHSSTNILATAAYDSQGNVQTVIGTGPYKLTLLEPPQRLAAERFDAYWGPQPSIEKVTYLGAGRGETRSLMAESGGAELVFQLDPPSIARLQRAKRSQVLIGAVPRVVVLAANAGNGATAPVAMRKALSLAIQRDGIAAAVLRAPGTGATQLFASSVPAWHNPALAPLTYDPEAARHALSAEGWIPGADGIREKNGQKLQLKLLTYSDRPELPLIATAVQAQLREVGVGVEVAVENASAIPAAHNDGTLQLALYGRNYALAPDPLVTLLSDFGQGGTEWGPMGWRNPTFDQSLTALLSTDDAGEQQRLRHQLIGLVQDELPLIPIAWYRQSIAVANSVEGARIDPFERTFGLADLRWAP